MCRLDHLTADSSGILILAWPYSSKPVRPFNVTRHNTMAAAG